MLDVREKKHILANTDCCGFENVTVCICCNIQNICALLYFHELIFKINTLYISLHKYSKVNSRRTQ